MQLSGLLLVQGPMNEWERFADLQRQGFMKPRKAPRKPKAPRLMVSCNGCLNWHYEGKHTGQRGATSNQPRRSSARD